VTTPPCSHHHVDRSLPMTLLSMFAVVMLFGNAGATGYQLWKRHHEKGNA